MTLYPNGIDDNTTLPPVTPGSGIATPIGPAGGDLGGTYPNPNVINIQGRSIASTAPANGQVLTWNGTAWAPTNISSGSVTLSGDVTGAATSNRVVNINGTSVPASPTVNQVLTATGSTTATWQQISDAQISTSAAIAVSKLAAGTSAQVLLNSSAPTPTWTTLSGGATISATGVVTISSSGVTLAGDVTGAGNANTVAKIQGVPVSTNSVTNDGYTLVSTGSSYIPSGIAVVYNVKNFGAKGDNSTNDTNALLAAFTAFQTALNSGVSAKLYFPAGQYLCGQELVISNISGGIIEGDGMHASTIVESSPGLMGKRGQIVLVNCQHTVVRDIGLSATNRFGVLSTSAASGTNSVTVSSFGGGTPSPGMKCAVANYDGYCDYLTIAQVSGNIVTFTTNLKHSYVATNYLLYGVLSGVCNYSDQTIAGHQVGTSNYFERVLVGNASGLTQMFGFAATCKGGGPVPLAANAHVGDGYMIVADAGEMFVGEQIQVWDIIYSATEVVLTIDTVNLLTNHITFHPNLTLNHSITGSSGSNTCFIQSLSDENNDNHTYLHCISENATVGAWYFDGFNQLDNKLTSCESVGVCYASFWGYRGGCAQIVSHAFGGSIGYNIISAGAQAHAWTINGGYDESQCNMLLSDVSGCQQFLNITWDQYDKKNGPMSGDLNMIEVTGYLSTIRLSNCSIQGQTSTTFYLKDYAAGGYIAGFEPATAIFSGNQIIAAGITCDGIYVRSMGNAYFADGNYVPTTLNGGQFYGALDIGGFLAGNTTPNMLTNVDTLTNLAGNGSGYVAVNNAGKLSYVAGTSPSGTAGGDLSGSYPNPAVISVTGASGVVNISSTGNVITWNKATTTPGLAQTAPTTDVAAANLTITSQGPYASASTNKAPGNIIFNTPAPVAGGNPGFTTIESGGTTVLHLGGVPGATTEGGVWFGSATPTNSNYILAYDNSATLYVGPTNTNINGNLLVDGNVQLNANSVTYAAAVTAPTISQTSIVSGTGVNMLIHAQDTSSGKGGNLQLQAGTGTTAPGSYVEIINSHGTLLQMGVLAGQETNATYYGIYPGGVSPTGSNFFAYGDTAGANVYFNANTSINYYLGNGTTTAGTITTSNWSFGVPILLKSIIFNDGYSGAVTTGATLTTIYTDSSMASSTLEDYVVTVVGFEPSTLDAYRADFSFTVINTAGTLSYIGASPIALNIRGTTNGLTWGGASIALSGTTVLVQVTGKASTSIDWSCSVNRIKGS